MPLTTPDSIYYPDTATTGGLVTAMAAQATSVQDAFDTRAILGYRWADSTARGAQTGMDAGDLGIQEDTDVVYRYTGSVWKAWESDWISYTATLSAGTGSFTVGTGGSASQVTQYRYEAGTVRVRYSFVLGSSGFAVGTQPKFTLPVTAVALAHPFFGYVSGSLGGTMFDTSATALLLSVVVADNTSTTVVRPATVNNVSGLLAYPTATTPWTWAAGDAMQGSFTYEAA